jgi:hypothetical protein
MAWKNLKQRSLADSMMLDHSVIKELGDVNNLISWPRIEKLLVKNYVSQKGEIAWLLLMVLLQRLLRVK